MKRLARMLALLSALQLVSACVSVREVELSPQITGTREAFDTAADATCPLWYAPSARRPISDEAVIFDDSLLLAGYDNELSPDPDEMPCYPYYLSYQTMLLFDLEGTGGTFVQSAFLEIDRRVVLSRGGTGGSNCRMLIGRAAENWPFGLTAVRGSDGGIDTTFDALLLDAFRSGPQRIDVTRIVRPQLTGINRGIVISPVPDQTFRSDFDEGEETACIVELSNPRLVLELVFPESG